MCGLVDSRLLRGFPQPRDRPRILLHSAVPLALHGGIVDAHVEAILAVQGTTRPLHKACGPLPIVRRTSHAACRTPSAARRTSFCVTGNGRCGKARSHAGAQLACQWARLQGSSRLSSFSCLSSSLRIFFIARLYWRCFCSGAQTISTQRTEAHRKLRWCAPLAGRPTFRRAYSGP